MGSLLLLMCEEDLGSKCRVHEWPGIQKKN